MRIPFLLLIWCLSMTCSRSSGQTNDPLKTLTDNLDIFRNRYPQEKVHIHFDKPYYSIGDTIWFKVYVVNAEKNQLSYLNNVVYVELLDPLDSVAKSLRLPLNSGLASAQFDISDLKYDGKYRVRAYTNWMRNFGEDYFFDKTIAIGNPLTYNVSASPDYKSSTSGGRNIYETKIKYQNLLNKPIAEKPVSYEVKYNNAVITRGKGVTGKDGTLPLKFSTTTSIITPVEISTSVLSDKVKPVTKTIFLYPASAKADVQFFPEGGQLVAGVRSKVGFKAVGTDGLGKDLKGYISDKNGKKATEFSSGFAGIGSFDFLPEAGNTYTATVKISGEAERKVKLPEINPEGYVLSINQGVNKNLDIRIEASKNAPEIGPLTLVAQSNSMIQYMAKSKSDTSLFSASLPAERFPEGIVQFTLFSASYKPIAERLVFVQHPGQRLNFDAQPDKKNYSPREKVDLLIGIQRDSSEAVASNFSVAVTNETVVPFADEDETTIISNLLLTSDLKGYIEKPNYYFTEVTEERITQLDNLMLTQGWRRFTWDNLLAGTFPGRDFREELGIHISGRVTNGKGEPLTGTRVTLFPKNQNAFVLDTLTDAKGRFNFSDLLLFDSVSYTVQALNKMQKPDDVIVEFDKSTSQPVTIHKYFGFAEISQAASMLTYMQHSRQNFDSHQKNGDLKTSIILKEVNVTEKKFTEINKAVRFSSNLNGPGNADQVLTYKDLQNCHDLGRCLEGKMAGVTVKRYIEDGKMYAYSTRSGIFANKNQVEVGSAPLIREPGMAVFLDGTQSDLSLDDIPAANISSIEILRPGVRTAVYGPRGTMGVIVITTKRGDIDYNASLPPIDIRPKGLVEYQTEALTSPKEFYSPVYNVSNTTKSVADLRTTVLWVPNVNITADGKAKLEYFNAGQKGVYKVVIEGLNSTGKTGRKVLHYTVN